MAPIPKRRLLKGPKLNQYVDICAIYFIITVPGTPLKTNMSTEN